MGSHLSPEAPGGTPNERTGRPFTDLKITHVVAALDTGSDWQGVRKYVNSSKLGVKEKVERKEKKLHLEKSREKKRKRNKTEEENERNERMNKQKRKKLQKQRKEKKKKKKEKIGRKKKRKKRKKWRKMEGNKFKRERERV